MPTTLSVKVSGARKSTNASHASDTLNFVLTDLVEQGLVADFQNDRSLLSIPIGLLQCTA